MAYVPHSDSDIEQMLKQTGASSLDDLFRAIPSEYRLEGELEIPEASSEWEVKSRLLELAGRNGNLISFAGAGSYDHYQAAAVDHLLLRSEWYTAYTPYQPEVSQGTLQAIYEFQTMICELFGMDVANASMYDGGSALAEASLMARAVKRGRDRVVIPASLNPAYRRVLDTYNVGRQDQLTTVPWTKGGTIDLEAASSALEHAAALIVQQPNYYGVIEDLGACARAAHDAGALLVVVANPVPLAVLATPGECGADIVVSEGQALGIAPSLGGPGLGIFATRNEYIRQMPGRIAGATVDGAGRRGYVLTLQTREQQIRREKATSNICTNQGLLALASTVQLAMLGAGGFEKVALRSAEQAHKAFDAVTGLDGYEAMFPESPFFNEFAVKTPQPAAAIVTAIAERGLLAGVPANTLDDDLDDDILLIAATEKRTDREINMLCRYLMEFE